MNDFRDKLTIPEDINFGLEIEMTGVNLLEVRNMIKEKFKGHYTVTLDGSLSLEKSAEIATPVFKNTEKDWEELYRLSEELKKFSPKFNGASLQINFDNSLLPYNKNRVQFLKLFAYFENVIYYFSKGYDKEFRRDMDIYARPLILALKYYMDDAQNLLKTFTSVKMYGVNYKHFTNLIEFRSPNGTINPFLWQNYITFFYYFIEYVRNYNIDLNYIDSYILNYNKFDMLGDYDNIDLEKANELVEMIFTDDLDKELFMKQYLKK